MSGLSAMAILSPSALVNEPEPAAAAAWDLSWIDTLKGKHKHVFDFGGMTWENRDVLGGDTPLRVPRNWFNAHKEVYALDSQMLSTVIGIASSGFPINASDAVWQKYSLGERWKIMDSSTGKWAVRNLFSNPSAPYTDRLSTVEALKQRGTIFWQCNNALNGIVQTLAASMKLNPDDVRKELVEGLMPGVKIVPAHTFAIGLVQEKGCTYEKM
jgi:hypothetical protein